MILLKNKIFCLFERLSVFIAKHYKVVFVISLTFAIVVAFIIALIPSLSAYAAVITNEITPLETIPLRTGYIQMPTEMVGARFLTLDGITNTDAFYALLFLQALTDPSMPFRYRFHGSDPGVYITQFTTELVSDTEFRVYGADGFVSHELFATVTTADSMQNVIFEPVDFVCVAETMSIDFISNFYGLALAGFAVPFEFFIDYGSGGGGTAPTCPTLPEMLADYTGSFASIVDMLNTKNYDEYDAWVNEVAQDARDAGKQEGLQEGFLIGKDAGYMEGEVDGFQDGYNKGTSDELVKGFFANLFGGIIEAFEKIEFYNDGSLVINFWTIFCSVVILSIIIILLKVWRGG